MKNFLEKINFTELKKQKHTLIHLIDANKLDPDFVGDVQGIINLIDSIQDIAVDKYGYKESDVFIGFEE